MRYCITFLLLTISILSFAQNETTEIPVIPYWEKDEVRAVIIKSTTTDIVKQKPITYATSFNAQFKVLEKTEDEYIVEWIYTNAKLAANGPNIENSIIAKLLNRKIKIKLSIYGKFIELVNAEELRLAANKALDDLIAKENTTSFKIQFEVAKKIIATNQGLEIALLKQIKLYNFSFGYSYKIDFEQTNNIKYPNPLGGEPFDAVEKVKLVNVDFKKMICTIETSKVVEGDILTKSILDFLKQNFKDHIKDFEKEFGNNVFEISENTSQELNFEKGILIKSSCKRIMNLGIQNRVVLMEIEAIN